MKDEAISLEVAEKLWPEYEWSPSDYYLDRRLIGTDSKGVERIQFNYKTKGALADMVLWYGRKVPNHYDSLLLDCISKDDPNRALAYAIMETVDE